MWQPQVLCQSTLVGTGTQRLILQYFIFILLTALDLDTRLTNDAITWHCSNTAVQTVDERKHRIFQPCFYKLRPFVESGWNVLLWNMQSPFLCSQVISVYCERAELRWNSVTAFRTPSKRAGLSCAVYLDLRVKWQQRLRASWETLLWGWKQQRSRVHRCVPVSTWHDVVCSQCSHSAVKRLSQSPC